MNKSMFLNTKWDVREWTDEMKQNWLNKVKSLSFEEVCIRVLDSTLYLWEGSEDTHLPCIYISDPYDFLTSGYKEMEYEDMFPEENEAPIATMNEECTSSSFIEADDIFTHMKTIAKENSMFISFDGLNDGEEDVVVVTHVSSDAEYVVNNLEEFSLLTQSFKTLEKFERKI